MAIEKKGMSAYKAERERAEEENKRKMGALNLRHLCAAVATCAPKTPSRMKHKRRRIIYAVTPVPSPPRRSCRLAHLPEVKYADAYAEIMSIYGVAAVGICYGKFCGEGWSGCEGVGALRRPRRLLLPPRQVRRKQR